MMNSSIGQSLPSKTIVVDRVVFESLVKAAEKGQLANSAVGSFESERRILSDSLVLVKALNVKIANELAGCKKDKFLLMCICIGLLIVIGVFLWFRLK